MNMRFSKFYFLLFISSISFAFVNAQTVVIPGFTGYAIPAEKLEENLFNEKKGLVNWTDLNQSIHFYPYFKKTGEVKLYLRIKTSSFSTNLDVIFAGKTKNVVIKRYLGYEKILVGTFNVKDTGYLQVSILCNKKTGKEIASIKSILFEGAAAKDLHFNKKERRNAASVHLKYPVPDSLKVYQFYTTINIPEGNDQLYSYYMATGFKRGYFGMQVNSENERRVIFSVWDAGKEAIDRNKVPDSNKVQLMAKGIDVVSNDFGNEGTGGHSHWVYPWRTNTNYGFLVNAVPDSATNSTIYTGYFHIPETNLWKLIASFKAPRDGNTLKGLYSFVENFIGVNGNLKRQAIFKNQWMQVDRGEWKELNEATFSYDATGRAGDRLDYNAMVNNSEFILENGGFTKSNISYGKVLKKNSDTLSKPVINLMRHVDSLVSIEIDKKIILGKIANKKETYKEEQGVYYSILKEGNGKKIDVADIVTIFYKGYLLQDDSIFDQTKDKPAIFPLNRLIKGWQIAVPKVTVGGTVRIIIPSHLAYSIRSRSFKIPPNSILVFDIEVIETKPTH